MLKLLIDLDSTTADLLKKWLAVYNNRFNDNLTENQILDFDIHNFTKCSKKEIYGMLNESGFFADLEVYDNAVEITKKLQENGHEIYFVTASPVDSPTAVYDKNKWVEQHFNHIGALNTLHTHKKHLIYGDLLFDDSPKNINDFNGIKIVYDQPYNQKINADWRVKNWLEFYDVVNKITEIKKQTK